MNSGEKITFVLVSPTRDDDNNEFTYITLLYTSVVCVHHANPKACLDKYAGFAVATARNLRSLRPRLYACWTGRHYSI